MPLVLQRPKDKAFICLQLRALTAHILVNQVSEDMLKQIMELLDKFHMSEDIMNTTLQIGTAHDGKRIRFVFDLVLQEVANAPKQ